MKTATKPPQPIEKSTAGASLLAQVIVAKTADHLPLHRQERIFERHGVDICKRPRITRGTDGQIPSRAILKFWGSSPGGRPVVRQQLGEPGNRMGGDAGEDVLEPEEGIDSSALAGSHETP